MKSCCHLTANHPEIQQKPDAEALVSEPLENPYRRITHDHHNAISCKFDGQLFLKPTR
jgi:hypothetical protein